jgi:SOS response regulatory protein OraA/RecX
VVNAFFELQRLRAHLVERGIDETTIENVVSKANEEISAMAHNQGKRAMEQAVQVGIENESANFINQLR